MTGRQINQPHAGVAKRLNPINPHPRIVESLHEGEHGGMHAKFDANPQDHRAHCFPVRIPRHIKARPTPKVGRGDRAHRRPGGHVLLLCLPDQPREGLHLLKLQQLFGHDRHLVLDVGIQGEGRMRALQRLRRRHSLLQRVRRRHPVAESREVHDGRAHLPAYAVEDAAGNGRFTHASASSRPRTWRTKPPAGSWATSSLVCDLLSFGVRKWPAALSVL